jgi:S1-C subfamily serine protease
VDLLDILFCVAVVIFAVSGYRQGFIVGVLSLIGFVCGLLLGIWLVPLVVRHFQPSLVVSVVAIFAVLTFAVSGQVVTTLLGSKLRRHLRAETAQALDAVAGSAVSIMSVLVVAWLFGLLLARSTVPSLTSQASNSAVLRGMRDVLPSSAEGWFSSFTGMLDRDGLPEVFAPFTEEPSASAAPPDPAVLNSPAVVNSRGSIVKVVGDAMSCDKQIEGSGFVYAPQHVITNAHVVGGVTSPTVRVDGTGPSYQAQVVLFDPERDIAVLYVPGLDAPPLRFDNAGQQGDNAVVAGFPENGPFTPRAARIRQVISAEGQDIYQRNDVTRSVFSLYAVVLQGNSGGPLLAPNGEVYGVVFAKSLQYSNTGYALTATEVEGDASAGASATQPVDTQTCAI